MGIGIRWIEPDGLAKRGRSFLGPAERLQSEAEIAEGRRTAWIEPDRFPIRGDRFLDPSQSLQRIAQRIQGFRIPRRKGQRAPRQFHGGLRLPSCAASIPSRCIAGA